MLKSLDELRMGLITPTAFTAEVKLRHTLDLTMAKHVSMPALHSAGVTTLDIERVEERYLLYGGKNGTVAIFDLANTTNKYPYSSEVVANMRPSPDTHPFTVVKVQWYPFDTGLFTTSSKCKSLKIWDTNSLKPVDTIKLDYHINSHDMSRVAMRHNLIAVAASNPSILLYDTKGGLATHQLKGHEAGVESVAWSPIADNLLASGGVDKRILLWDVRSAKGFLKCLDQHNFSGNTAIGNKTFGYKKYGTKSNLPTAHNSPVSCLKFTDNGLFLVSRSADNEVLLWDVAFARNTLVNYGIPLRNYNLFNLPFSFDIFNDSKLPLLFNPYNCGIDIHNLFTGVKYTSLVGHFKFVNCCVYRSSTQELYSGGDDMNVIAWAPAVGSEIENEIPEESVLNQLENAADSWSESTDSD